MDIKLLSYLVYWSFLYILKANIIGTNMTTVKPLFDISPHIITRKVQQWFLGLQKHPNPYFFYMDACTKHAEHINIEGRWRQIFKLLECPFRVSFGGGDGLNILVYVVSEATRNGFRYHKFPKYSWESTPWHPYLCSYYCTTQFFVQQILYKNLKILQYSPRPPSISQLLHLPPLDENPGWNPVIILLV